MGSITTRVLATAGAVLAAVVLGGPSMAAASPAEESGVFRSANAYARSGLTGPDGLGALANVTSFDRAAPTADLAIFVSGYTCVPSEAPAVALVALASATVEGDLDLVCSPDNSHEDEYPDGGPTLTGTATVDLSWTGVGWKLPEISTQDLRHCVVVSFERAVVLAGGIEIDVAGLYTGSTTEYRPYTDTALRFETLACSTPRR